MVVHVAAKVVQHVGEGKEPGKPVSLGEDRVVAEVEGKPGDRLSFNQPVTVARVLYCLLYTSRRG